MKIDRIDIEINKQQRTFMMNLTGEIVS